MGCAGSKEEESPVLALCRERRDLIRAAADGRYAFASAHAAYFRALAAVGDALQRFAREELIPIPSPPSSPHLTLPSSEGKPKPSRSPSNGAASSSSSTALSHSLSIDGSHLHLSSDPPSDPSPEARREAVRPPSPSPSPPRPAETPSPSPIPNYNYMQSSTAIPTMVYEQNPYSYSYYGYADYEYGYPPYGVPIGSPGRPEQEAYRDPTPPPPPPPPAGVSAWDFFNPFDSYEQYLPEFMRFRMSSVVSSPDSNEVREQEGIPDLEDETEPEQPKKPEKKAEKDMPGRKVEKEKPEKEKEKENERKKKVMTEDAGAGTSKVVPEPEAKEEAKDVMEEKDSKSGSEGGKSKGSGEEEGQMRRKSVSFEDDISLATEASGMTALSTHATRNIVEAVEDIKEQFRLAAKCGEDVSRMLEVGKLRSRSANGILRAIFSWILDFMSLPALLSSQSYVKHSQDSYGSALAANTSSPSDSDNHIGMKSANLSSTLEKLYEWEKKLYKEVKEEEKLRVLYDRKYAELKALDDTGAESYKIDSTRESIKELRTKISVILKSVDVISMRMHRIRDEELEPQLAELIQGLIRMWQFVLECHQKQFQVIVESKTQNLIAKTAIQRNSLSKVTIELEQELLHWCSCFKEWIASQKVYIEALNGWLIRWLPQEQEVTPDGVVPFSPSRIGAPAIFILSNDWFHAMQRISEVEVIRAMHSFAANVHELWESQGEEQRRKLKAEYLSRDFSRRLKTLQKENATQGNLDVILASENGQANNHDHMKALDSMRKRLDEERAKHAEAVKQVQEAASNSLRKGLVPIFEALKNFTSETLKAYEGLRMPTKVGQNTAP